MTTSQGTGSTIRTRWASTSDFSAMAALDLSAEYDPDNLTAWAADPHSILILAEFDQQVVGWVRIDRRNQRVLISDMVLAGSGAGHNSPGTVAWYLAKAAEAIARRRHVDRLGIIVGERQAVELHACRTLQGACQQVHRRNRSTIQAFCFGFRLFKGGQVAEQYYAGPRPWVAE